MMPRIVSRRSFPGVLMLCAALPLCGGCDGGAGIPRPGGAESMEPFDLKDLRLYYIVSVDQATSLLKNHSDLLVMDVRSPEEHAAGGLPRAVNFPWPSDDFEERIASLDRQRRILLYGMDRELENEAVRLLRSSGFALLHWMTDGYEGWMGWDLEEEEEEETGRDDEDESGGP